MLRQFTRPLFIQQWRWRYADFFPAVQGKQIPLVFPRDCSFASPIFLADCYLSSVDFLFFGHWCSILCSWPDDLSSYRGNISSFSLQISFLPCVLVALWSWGLLHELRQECFFVDLSVDLMKSSSYFFFVFNFSGCGESYLCLLSPSWLLWC